jgi:dihydrofolate reductase
MTLDGFFEGRTSWDLSFHEDVWGEDLERFSLEQLKEVGALLFGRKTYEGMAEYWSTAEGEIAWEMNTVPKIVFSTTLAKADWSNTRLVSGKAEEEVEKLKQEAGKDLFVFGSADLASSLTRAGLIDEYRVCVTPHLLGAGNPLFRGSDDTVRLRLLDARPTATGAVILRYRRAP